MLTCPYFSQNATQRHLLVQLIISSNVANCEKSRHGELVGKLAYLLFSQGVLQKEEQKQHRTLVESLAHKLFNLLNRMCMWFLDDIGPYYPKCSLELALKVAY